MTENRRQIRITSNEPRGKVKGFSLTEVLLAIGTLAIGMLFIAAVFPASINLTTISSERTIAAEVADEAFAKIKLYGLPAGLPFNTLVPVIIDYNEYGYPSTPAIDPNSKRYWWSALCNRVNTSDFQVTVFVCRKVGANPKYLYRDATNMLNPINRPVPVNMSVSLVTGTIDELQIIDLPSPSPDGVMEKTLINDGYTIIDTAGRIYRVIERYSNNDTVIKLDQPWRGLAAGDFVFVIPPPVNSSHYPCIAVYQKVIRF